MNILKKCLTAVFTISIMLLLCTFANADDGVIGRTPEGVYPMKDSEVEMESENIIVDIEKSTVECTFVFHNTGEARDVLMGFPGKLREDLGSDFSDDVSLSLNDFKTFVKGKRLPVKREKGIQPEINMPLYSEWFTFTVPFAKGERVTVRNTYSFRPSYVSTGDVFTGYVLQTGATWKGTIGKARVEFKLGSIQPWQIEQLRPGGFRFEGDCIVWERRDFEPSYDLSLDYNSWYYSSDFLDSPDFNGEQKDNILLKIKKYKEIKELAEYNENESLFSKYQEAVEARDTVLAVYTAGFLPKAQIPDEAPVLGEIKVIQEGTAYRAECDIKSIYKANMLLQVSHMEDGKTIYDLEEVTTNCQLGLTPGVEYDITITVTDWLDRTVKKAIKYKLPTDTSDGVDVNAASSIDAASKNNAEAANDSAGASSAVSGDSVKDTSADNNVQSPTMEQPSDELPHAKIYVWTAVSVLALGCMAAGTILYRRHRV